MRLILCLNLAACAPGSLPSLSDGVALGGVRYQLDWDLHGVVVDGGWSVVSDLGWTWRVEDGALTVWQASLVPCAKPVARLRWFPAAVAGHGGDVDPSTTDLAQVEPLRELTAATLDVITFDEARYCGAHLAIGAAKPDSLGVDSLPGMVGQSLWLRGTHTSPEGEEAPFELRTAWSHGVLVDLPPADTARVVGVEVHAHRAPGGLWDGVDPGVMSEAARDWQVLENLIAGTTLEAHYMPVSALGEPTHDHSHGP